MDAAGRPKETQWCYMGGRSIAQIDTECLQQYAFLRGDQWSTPMHPFCDHDDASAFLLPPLSDPWATDLLGDLCATVLNMLKTSRRPWRPWRGLHALWATLERPRQTFSNGLSPVLLGIIWTNADIISIDPKKHNPYETMFIAKNSKNDVCKMAVICFVLNVLMKTLPWRNNASISYLRDHWLRHWLFPCSHQLSPLEWRHNERDGVSYHRRLHCLLNLWGADQWKHQCSASLAFVRGIHRSVYSKFE